MSRSLLPGLREYLDLAAQDFDQITPERKAILKTLAIGVQQQLQTNGTAALIYICTHNSRRSHMGQLWAAAAAAYYHIDGITTYSGGTEITAFNINAVQALAAAGFDITPQTADANPMYHITFGSGSISAFSKKYTDTPNPVNNFIAVMTCSHADDNCPYVAGASLRIATPYKDPKESDGSPEQTQTYRDRCREIATEVLYTFYQVALPHAG